VEGLYLSTDNQSTSQRSFPLGFPSPQAQDGLNVARILQFPTISGTMASADQKGDKS
jgi:hypothetical protein